AAGLTPQDSAELLRLGATPEQLTTWNAPEPPAPKPPRRKRKVAADPA
ncbi:MAG: tRNA (guanosine(37)-N1)-methyltransferase TrmD, partial [Deinococcus sp.]|nr:tRNA (guanosine(37)-N1)-methyltransferase TrmD [Deinococcus sp.]